MDFHRIGFKSPLHIFEYRIWLSFLTSTPMQNRATVSFWSFMKIYVQDMQSADYSRKFLAWSMIEVQSRLVLFSFR